MKRWLLLFFFVSLLAAQTNLTDDTSKEEALLDELLNTTTVDESSPASTPEQQPAPSQNESYNYSQESIPAQSSGSTDNGSSMLQQGPQDSEPSAASDAEVQSEPAPRANYSSRATTTGSRPQGTSSPDDNSPDLSEEARIQETPDIPNFSHKAHIEDVGAECVQCHQTLFAESVRGIKTGPSMKEICGQCHNGTDAPSELLAGFSDEKKYVRTNLPKFSHTTHQQHTEKCTVCHTDIYGKLKDIKIPPPMNRCSGCHNDQRANSDCKVCHENPEKLKPKSHTSQWVYRNGHGKTARLNQKECKSCHTDRDCDACHRGQTPFEVHRPGYRFTHGMDARQRVVNCGYCHDAKYSCTQCHERKQ